MQTIGVIGAGTMGAGVAQTVAESGFRVVVIDTSRDALNNCLNEIRRQLKVQKLLRRRDGSADEMDILDRVVFTQDYGQLHDAALIVENVPEDLKIKHAVYQTLSAVCSKDCILAANTSAISITQIGSFCADRATRIIGVHFMNPAYLKPTVEVVKGHHTSEHTLEQTKAFLKQLGKDYIVVGDSPGFVSNRILMLTINEAIFVLYEQVASVADIDDIFKRCFGHKMGPLETADLIGLDTILNSLHVLYQSFLDSKFRPCPLLHKMVNAGLLGRKTGQGFYSYQTALTTKSYATYDAR